MDFESLTAYLQKIYPDYKGLRITNFTDITSGWETRIFSFNMEWSSEQDSMHEGFIIRVYSPQLGSEKARKESSVMNILSRVGYPVPKIHVTETDVSHLGSPFIIMDRIDGATLEDLISIPGADIPKWVELFSRLFVQLHILDWTAFIKDSQSNSFHDPYFIINTSLSDYENLLNRYRKKELLPILEWLKSRVDSVPCKKPSITHGDYHPMNILIDKSENPYVIDWGAANVNDFRRDLAWTLLLTRAYSTPENRNQLFKGYQRAANYPVEEIEYFEVLAILRRLFDVRVSMSEGADAMGLREDARDMIKSQMAHVRVVYELLGDLTGIEIYEISDWLSSF
ncbi:MAG: phosphotransferase family protein [Promethearchaeota archaeon]